MTKNELKEEVDTHGVDDYWFLDDIEELEDLVLRLNHYETTLQLLRKVVATNPQCYNAIKDELIEALRIHDWGGIMVNKDLLTLYSVFDLLNNQEISTSPSMSNPTTYYFAGILTTLQRNIDNNTTPTKTELKLQYDFLTETNQCYYQPSELRPPVRINNCPYIEICNKLMEES